MITLYQAEWCPWCHRVRQVLSELGLTYTTVNVPVERAKRKQVEDVSGQVAVPVLVDGDKVLTDSGEIIDYVRATYPPAEDVDDQAEVGGFRWVIEFDEPPSKVLKRVKEALAAAGFNAEFGQVTMKAENETELTGDEAARMQKLIDVLESLDDVQEVYTSVVLED